MLDMYEQPWLREKETVTLSYEELDIILFDLKAVRKSLLDLAFEEDYGERAQEFLNITLESILSIEDSIYTIKESDLHSSKALQRQYGNLQGSFIANFMYFDTCYQEYINDEQ
ncbi:hypothetical protein ACFQ3N_01065 [Virgibacillus byunsanensis]|uniref:Uncharacterized protein n=1 Tax=Virgibacillus byunsanensis TaxID=570945 RepID=A0ABW3LGQ0_9BACI